MFWVLKVFIDISIICISICIQHNQYLFCYIYQTSTLKEKETVEVFHKNKFISAKLHLLTTKKKNLKRANYVYTDNTNKTKKTNCQYELVGSVLSSTFEIYQNYLKKHPGVHLIVNFYEDQFKEDTTSKEDKNEWNRQRLFVNIINKTLSITLVDDKLQ